MAPIARIVSHLDSLAHSNGKPNEGEFLRVAGPAVHEQMAIWGRQMDLSDRHLRVIPAPLRYLPLNKVDGLRAFETSLEICRLFQNTDEAMCFQALSMGSGG